MKSLLKGFILLAFVFGTSFSSAQTNTNIKTTEYKDVSPGVVGSLKITTETISEDKGFIVIYGSLKYDFPPQPQKITFTIKNADNKTVYKDYTLSSSSQTPNNINIAIVDVPLDKTSATKTLATADRFKITSQVDRGVDFFFPNSNPTYLTFNKYTPLPDPGSGTTQGGQNGGQQSPGPIGPDPVLNPIEIGLYNGGPIAKSLSLSSVKLLKKADPKDKNSFSTAEVEFAALTLLPSGYALPSYINFVRVDDNGKPLESLVDEWKPVTNDPEAPRIDGTVLGASKHKITIDSGKTYLIQTWISQNPAMKTGEGVFLGDFTVNSDYIFGRPVSYTAPGLAPINNAQINSTWDSLTSTFEPGSIDFFKVGITNVSAQGSEDSYVFLSKIPGLANSTKDGREAFDPNQPGAFSKYISIIINMIYGFIALLAVINIIRYGLSLMLTSSTPFQRSESKNMIWNSFIALGIALGTYLILNTINPNLTSFNIGISKIEITGKSLSLENLSTDGSLPDNYIGTKGASCEKCFVYPVDPGVCPGNKKRGDHGGYKGPGGLGGNSADLSCPTGTRVQSVSPGTVYSAGSNCREGDKKCGGGMGNYVIVEHKQANGKPWYSIYMHLSNIAVKGGQVVSVRQEIGRSGNSGDSTGPHLHFETTNENIGTPGKQKYPNCVLSLTCDSYK